MTATPISETNIAPINLIWGARNIGRVIGRSEAQTHYLLASRGIPGAKRVGGRWCIPEEKLRTYFSTAEDA